MQNHLDGPSKKGYPFVLPEMFSSLMQKTSPCDVIVEGRDDVETRLENGSVVLTQLKYVNETSNSTEDAKHYAELAAFVLCRKNAPISNEYFELRTTALLKGKGKKWEEEQKIEGTPSLLTLILKQSLAVDMTPIGDLQLDKPKGKTKKTTKD